MNNFEYNNSKLLALTVVAVSSVLCLLIVSAGFYNSSKTNGLQQCQIIGTSDVTRQKECK